MKKTIVVFASTLLLLGAGCGGGATDVGVADTYQQEVETAFAAMASMPKALASWAGNKTKTTTKRIAK